MRKRFSLVQAVLGLLIFVFVFVTPLVVHREGLSAQEKAETSQTKTAFIKSIAPASQELAKAYGIKPSIIIAQASLESDFGRTLLARRYDNLFNSKALTGEAFIKLRDSNGQLVSYVRYKSYQESISAYLAQLKAGQVGNSNSYKLFVANKNVNTLADVLQSSGFSTSKTYAKELKSIIKTYQLTDYDK